MQQSKQLAKVEQPIKDTVNGYIRNINKNDLIPKDIINMVILYYCILFKFYTDQYGKNMEFPTDQRVKKNQRKLGNMHIRRRSKY